MLITRAIEVHEFVESHVNPAQLDRDTKKAFYLLLNAMLTSLSDKARRIATGGGNIEELAPFEMLTRLEKHFLPLSTANDIQLRCQLYPMKMTADKTIKIFANKIRTLVNRINAIDTN